MGFDMPVFNHYVLNDEPPDRFIKGERAVYRPKMPTNRNVFFTPNKVNGQRREENVTEVRNFFIDIDAGKTADGRYLPMDEVKRRKKSMKEVIRLLPKPTVVVESRNGFHVYWSLKPSEFSKKESYMEHVRRIKDVIGIADKVVGNPAQILRLPNSIHKKDGCEPFRVKIVSARPLRYTMEDFMEQLNDSAAVIRDACDGYRSLYPDLKSSTVQAVFNASERGTSPAPDNDRLRAVSALEDLNLDVEETVVGNRKEFYEMAKQFNLREFLSLPRSFHCVFPDHEDNNPSAGIDYRHGKWLYVCSTNCPVTHGRYVDIFSVVEHLADCTKREAYDYVRRQLKIRIGNR